MSGRQGARALRLMGFDVDGVLTDGLLYYSPAGDEMKAFSVRDGHGVKMLRNAGIEPVIITGRRSRALELRAENLGIGTVLQGVEDKRGAMDELLRARGLNWAQCGYMGDDVVDLPLLRAAGFSATVPDGHFLVKRYVHYVATQPAGRGAVREVCEWILQAQGLLDNALKAYLA